MKKASLIILLVAFCFAGVVFLYTIPNSAMRKLSAVRCEGTIISMEHEAPCFVTVSVKQLRDTTSFDVGHCCDDNAFFEFTGIGDSVQKNTGSLLIIVFRKNNGLKRTFELPTCYE
jgi:hypothetical protein